MIGLEPPNGVIQPCPQRRLDNELASLAFHRYETRKDAMFTEKPPTRTDIEFCDGYIHSKSLIQR